MNEIKKKVFSEEKLRTLIIKKTRSIYVPASVYRLQLNHKFTFKHAEKLIPYLKKLGIDAVYCSPYFESIAGSMHGYNVANPNVINEEIGSWNDYLQFCEALRANEMGQIADIVPNHMGIGGNNNSWWQDVLENGQSSLYSSYFDIDWKPVKQELAGKVLLPVLGNFYGSVLENQEIKLNYEKGEFFVSYFERKFPIDPKTYPLILECADESPQTSITRLEEDYQELLSINTAFKNLPPNTENVQEKMTERNREKEISKKRLALLIERSNELKGVITKIILDFNGTKGEPKSFDKLDNLLNLQPYRLAYWAVASQEINYRRFFDINELAAIHTEDEKVFLHYHQLLFKLIREGKINGLRIDHPDGLYDPPIYFRRLQSEYILQIVSKEFKDENDSTDQEQIDEGVLRKTVDALLVNEFIQTPIFYVVIEKILARHESLPENWIVQGTVGYDFLNALNGLFVDRRKDEVFARLYEEFTGLSIDFENLVYDVKKFFGLFLMASEMNALGHRLDLISETNRNFRDFTREELTAAIRETIAGFPVYRTYVSSENEKISERDEKNIRDAIAKAREKNPILNSIVFDFFQETLLLTLKTEEKSEEINKYKDFLFRFQQLTGPIMAKGVEDTSFYIYNRLLSLNEVGGDPFCFGYTPKDFHDHNILRSKRWPCSMLTTSTHDTKRSEDIRMRINVLSEIPEEWKTKITEWQNSNREFKTLIKGLTQPNNNTEYFIYQTLIGLWPDEPMAPESFSVFIERFWQNIHKSIREAKTDTSWTKPNVEYENAVEKFVRSILIFEPCSTFLANFIPFHKKISFMGKLNSLSATIIKISSPGVVDVYQGNETWNYCLVDPDNRKPVDYEYRQDLLKKMEELQGHNGNMSMSSVNQENMRHLKILYTMKSLIFRRKHKEVFTSGEYIPLEVKGAREHNVIAFICKHGKDISLTASGRYYTEWGLNEKIELGPQFWADTEIVLPNGLELPFGLIDVITSETINLTSRDQLLVIKIADIFNNTCARIMTNVKE